MWDDDFSKKKFELGRVIERGSQQISKDLSKLDINATKKENYERGRIVNTTNIDFFLNCDNMNDAEIAAEKLKEEEEDDSDPLWADIEESKLTKMDTPQQLSIGNI